MESWELKVLIEKKEKELFWDKISFDDSWEKFKEIREKERELEVLKEAYWRW